jgi:rhodanese-related sulfurtransferase
MREASVNPSEFWRMHEFERDTMLIDVSDPADFEHLHAEGALPLPPSDLSLIAKQAKICDKQLYLISRTGQFAAGLATELERRGFDNVTAIAGGTEAWTACHLPVRYRHVAVEDSLRAAAGLIAAVAIVSAIMISNLWMLPVLGFGGLISVLLMLWADTLANRRVQPHG